MKGRRIAFVGRQQIELHEFDVPEVQPDQVLVRSLYSLMSTGTENIVLNRLFEPDSHWDRWVKYPFYPGYSSIGEVVETGAEVKGLKPGDIVASRTGHQSHAVMGQDQAIPVPAGLDPAQASWFMLGKIAFMGARASEYTIGDTLLVIGAGPIGQMTVRWARAAGAAQITVVDPIPFRLEMALKGGATTAVSKPVSECRDEVAASGGGRLPRVVCDTTGSAAVFSHALELADRFGRVVVLGDTGTPSGQRLTPDLIMRGLTIVGAHDGHEDGQWNTRTITQLLLQFVVEGRFSLEGLITDVFSPSQAVEAYGAANERRGETMGIVFDWSRS